MTHEMIWNDGLNFQVIWTFYESRLGLMTTQENKNPLAVHFYFVFFYIAQKEIVMINQDF